MKFIKTAIPDVYIIEPSVFEDERGYFLESFNLREFEENIYPIKFVQDNESKSFKGVLRGLHFQKPPFEQAKLVRVLKGSILDLAVDLRSDSPTYLQHVAIELSALNFKQVFIPCGFAHGFLTLEDDCEITYKISNYYNASSDVSVSIFDKDIGITLPCKRDEITFSSKDAAGQSWSSVGEIF